MIVDSSAIVAIIRGEADAGRFAHEIAAAGTPRISAANWLEAAMVVDRRGDTDAAARFNSMFGDGGIQIVPVSVGQARLAREAWERFGKGSGHSAQLNFGDCLAYGTARDLGEPLLFKGNDFSHTDIEPALKD